MNTQGLLNKIERAAVLYDKKKTPRAAYPLIIRYWAVYSFTRDEVYLNKAYFTAVDALDRNPCDTRLKFMRVYFDILKDEMSSAIRLLASLEPFKNALRQNTPEDYCYFMCLSVLVDIKINKEKSAAKKIKKLGETEAEALILPVLLGFIEIERKDYKSAYGHFVRALKKNYGVFMAQVGLNTLFGEEIRVKDTHYVFTGFLMWAQSKGIIFEDLIEHYQSSVTMRSSRDEDALTAIYKDYPERFILDLICQILIINLDYSEYAYRYYKEAQDRQLMVTNLETHLVRASFVSKNEDIARFTMSNFLKRQYDDPNLKAFVYHLLATNPKFDDLAADMRPVLLEFTSKALWDGERGIYYNSLYHYYLKTNAADADKSLLKVCADVLYEDLFAYEAVLPNENIKTIWVFDKEKSEHGVFEAVANPPYKTKINIKSVSKTIDYICFDQTGYNIIQTQVDFRRRVVSADFELYRFFAGHYPDDLDLCIVMARHITLHSYEDDESVAIINKALGASHISHSFRMNLTAHLGSILAGRGGYDKAIEYYRVADWNYLSDKYIEQMLNAFLNAKEYELAIRLIIKKSHYVTDRALFFAVKQIAAFEEYHKQMADIAYELLLKSWYDKILIDIVIGHYNGSQEDYQALAAALYNIQAPEASIDRRILLNCIEMHKLDKESQKVFIRVYQAFPDTDITEAFIYYLCYEMLVLNTKIEYETALTLEWRFEATKDKLIAYALTNWYLTHNIKTNGSNGIIERALSFMEEDGIIFGCAAMIKDKERLRPYIIKNTGFSYKCLPGRNVYLNYKVKTHDDARDKTGGRYTDDTAYRVKMKYFRFGLYMCAAPNFYNEELIYYFSEEMPSGSVNTPKREIKSTRARIVDESEDMFFTVNNALIYEQMFRYDEVEKIITSSLATTRLVMGELL